MTSALLPAAALHPPHEPALLSQYRHVRTATETLVADLSDADATVQSMDDASPAKWHLAHTTWFFEEFVLAARIPDYEPVDPDYRFLFNSYYEAVGPRHPRPQRGLLTRPSLDEVLAYREAVDESMLTLLGSAQTDDEAALIMLGLQHEQQHQELLLTDILHLFAQNPLRPAFAPELPEPVIADPRPAPDWIGFDGGWWRSATAARPLPLTAKGRGTRSTWRRSRCARTRSATGNGLNSSRMAATRLPGCGCPTAGAGCASKASRPRSTGKNAKARGGR